MKDFTYLVMVIVSILITFQAFAEYEDNGLSGETIIRPGSGTSSGDSTVDAAGGSDVVGGHLVSTSNIEDHSAQNEKVGRKEKTIDAIGQGNSGVGAAIAAGVSLTATGVSLLPWPTTPQGVALITLGAIEFAQAGATTGVTNDNKDGRDVLKSGSTTGIQYDDSVQKQLQNDISKKVDSPELREYLEKNGVNSDNFLQQLASGQLSNPEDVMRAMNITDPISSADLQKAMDEAASGFSGKPEGNGMADTARIKVDDSAGSAVPHTTFDSSSRGSGSIGNGNSVNPAGSPEARAAMELEKQLLEKARELAAKEIAEAQLKGEMNLDPDKLVQKYLAQLKGQKQTGYPGVSELKLAELGVKTLRPKQNVFDLSHITYRSFAKWRKPSEKQKTKVALK